MEDLLKYLCLYFIKQDLANWCKSNPSADLYVNRKWDIIKLDKDLARYRDNILTQYVRNSTETSDNNYYNG